MRNLKMPEIPKAWDQGGNDWAEESSVFLPLTAPLLMPKAVAGPAWDVQSTSPCWRMILGFLAGCVKPGLTKQIPAFAWLDTEGGREPAQALKI